MAEQFDGLHLNLGNLSRLSHAQSRSIDLGALTTWMAGSCPIISTVYNTNEKCIRQPLDCARAPGPWLPKPWPARLSA